MPKPSETIIRALRRSPMTRYQLSKLTGVAEGTLSKLLTNKTWIGRESFDALMKALKLEITPAAKRKKR